MLNPLSEINKLEHDAMIHANLGMESYAQKEYKKALACFRKVIENLESLLLEIDKIHDEKNQNLDKFKTAVIDIVTEINKKNVSILNKLGEDEWKKGNYVVAIVYYEESIKINPKDANIYNMIGYMYKKIGNKYQNLDKQIKYFEKAIELAPNHIQAIRSLAVTYPLVGRTQESIEYFHKLFELGPAMDDYVAYARLKIQLGDFEEGWKYKEYRFLREDNLIGYPEIDKPKWEGQKIPHETLLVHYEQGLGDTIQFCRYLEQAKPLAKKVIFRVQNELVDLLKISMDGIEVFGMSTPLEELSFDYHVPLMSLLHLTNASIDNIPLTQGYIKADKNKAETYKKEFFNNDCIKIGISYNGAKFGNRRRNVPLSYFYPIAKLKNIKIYSFQKGYGSEQLEKLPPDINIVDLGSTFNNFSDTAAAMANLDLFITSDNSVFNLAGAMGMKTCVLLNKYSEWRWFFDEETTPWYDSVKIFKKQNEDESWDLLMQKILRQVQKSKF
jgi:tetratricopeptide (TPR) repeat protein